MAVTHRWERKVLTVSQEKNDKIKRERGGGFDKNGLRVCLARLAQRFQTCVSLSSVFFFSRELLAAAGEEREVPGALHVRDEQGGVLSQREAGDILDRRGRPQQHAL